MTGLYLIIVMSVSGGQCPSPGFINATLNVSQANLGGWPTPTCSCDSRLDVDFTLSKAKADAALEAGAQVWKISTMPLKIVKRVREAKTIFNVTENQVEVKP